MIVLPICLLQCMVIALVIVWCYAFLLSGERNNWKVLCHPLLYGALFRLATCALCLAGTNSDSCPGAGFQDPQCQDRCVEWFKGDFSDSLHHIHYSCPNNNHKCCSGSLQQCPSNLILWWSTGLWKCSYRTRPCTKGIIKNVLSGCGFLLHC